jgi:hypothetical protein
LGNFQNKISDFGSDDDRRNEKELGSDDDRRNEEESGSDDDRRNEKELGSDDDRQQILQGKLKILYLKIPLRFDYSTIHNSILNVFKRSSSLYPHLILTLNHQKSG